MHGRPAQEISDNGQSYNEQDQIEKQKDRIGQFVASALNTIEKTADLLGFGTGHNMSPIDAN